MSPANGHAPRWSRRQSENAEATIYLTGDADLANSDKKVSAINSETLIGVGTIVDGNITVSGSLRVDGQVSGNVSEPTGQTSTLIVGEKGHVAGNVRIAKIIVHGLVTGQVYARNFLSLQSKAQVNCDVEYAEVEIHSGAVVQGLLSHRQLASQDDLSRSEAA